MSKITFTIYNIYLCLLPYVTYEPQPMLKGMAKTLTVIQPRVNIFRLFSKIVNKYINKVWLKQKQIIKIYSK